jgi:hypothetical protein
MLIRLALMTLVLLVGAETPPPPRVRSSHPYIRAMIAEAQVRSPTFRRLVNAIAATDGIVYVEEGECRHHLRSCLPPVVTATADVRMLRVLVDARLEDWQVMSDIGHELQHALEVLGDPGVRTSAGLFFHLYPTAFVTRDVLETADAVKVEEAIKSEVKAFSRSTTTKGLSRREW